MIYRIRPAKLKGDVIAPPSKSLAHRAVICNELAGGDGSGVRNVVLSEDIKATTEGIKKLLAGKNADGLAAGSQAGPADGLKTVKNAAPVVIDCNESGSTLRFLIPIAAALGGEYVFTGKGRLVERPIGPYLEIFDMLGIEYRTEKGGLPLYFKGRLVPGTYSLSGDVSSQFISGMLLALPLLEGDSRLVITTKLESAPYVGLTIETQRAFGVEIFCEYDMEGNLCYYISGRQKYKATEYEVEGDFSQGAFWEVANYLGNELNIKGLNLDSYQGDKEIINIIKQFESGAAEVTVDASQIPDLVPIVTVAAVFFKGKTNIVNAERLRIKESDRLAAIASELNALGADIKELPEGLVINGGTARLKGGRVRSHNDHRIAMSIAIAATASEGDIFLEGPECVRKSYPDFWDVYRRLGGMADEFNMG